MIFLSLLLAFALQTPDKPSNDTAALLRAKDQAMLDATAPGDRKVWDAVLASDAVCVDENGVIFNRSDLLKQLEPLPPGASGTLKISYFSAQVSGDMAIVIHKDDEQENYHGQQLSAQYLTTEAWQKEDGEWKLHLIHVYAVPKDPPTITLPAKELEQYVGTYSAAPDLMYVIKFDGQRLVGGRQGSSPKPLNVEVRDVLFVPGQTRIRKIFQRDPKGKITGFVDRRESWDLVWTREAASHSKKN